MRRWARIGFVAGTAVVGSLAAAGPAAAHTEIHLNNDQAGAANVRMVMRAEAEDDAAGITSVQVTLPAGLTADQVSLASAPAGWTLTPAGDGYTVTGKVLPAGVDARIVVTLAHLPDRAGVLTLRTVVTYSDGRTDGWVESPTAADPHPDHPAPTVSLRPATAMATAAVTTPGHGRVATGWLAGGAVVVVAAAAAVGWLVRRRRAGREVPATTSAG